jgi:hypothetical protein
MHKHFKLWESLCLCLYLFVWRYECNTAYPTRVEYLGCVSPYISIRDGQPCEWLCCLGVIECLDNFEVLCHMTYNKLWVLRGILKIEHSQNWMESGNYCAQVKFIHFLTFLEKLLSILVFNIFLLTHHNHHSKKMIFFAFWKGLLYLNLQLFFKTCHDITQKKIKIELSLE